MDNNQKKLFELLIELKDICQKNKIDMFLDEKLLYDAVNNKMVTGNYHEFSVVIKCDDIEKLMKKVTDIDNRSIECLLNNKNFPGLYLRYVADDTLYFPILKYGQFNKMGYGIDIHVLKSSKGSKLDNIFELGIENLNSLSLSGGLKPKVYAVLVWFLSLFGKKRLSSKIFKRINKVQKSKKYYYKKLLSKTEKYDKNIFENKRSIKLNGELFEVPDNDKYILNRTKRINANNINVNYANDDYILDTSMPYKEFFDECKKRKLKLKMFGISNIIFLIRKIKIKRSRRYINRCWNIMFRTRDRFELRDYYEPLKEEILNLYSHKKYDELSIILKKYIDLLEYYHSKKLGFVFDPVIFDITIEVLLYNGRNDFVKELLSMIPKAHRVPMIEK